MGVRPIYSSLGRERAVLDCPPFFKNYDPTRSDPFQSECVVRPVPYVHGRGEQTLGITVRAHLLSEERGSEGVASMGINRFCRRVSVGRRLSTDRGRVFLVVDGVTDSGLKSLRLERIAVVYETKLKQGFPKFTVADSSSGDLKLPSTSTEEMGLVTTGSEFSLPDLFESGKGGRPMICSSVKGDVMSTTTICRRSSRRVDVLPMPSSGLLGMDIASITTAITIIPGVAGKTSRTEAKNTDEDTVSPDASTTKVVGSISGNVNMGYVKLDIHLSSVDPVPFTRVIECSGGRKLQDFGSDVIQHVGSSQSDDLQVTAMPCLSRVRTKVGGRLISTSLGRGLVVLGFPSLRGGFCLSTDRICLSCVVFVFGDQISLRKEVRDRAP